MTQMLIAMVAIYFLLVGAAGNGQQLWTDGVKQIPGFLPWAGVIFVLGFLAVNKHTEELGKPLIILMVLAYLLKDNTYQTIQTGIVQAYDQLTKQLSGYVAPVPETSQQTKPIENNSTAQNLANIENKGIL